MTAPVVDVVVVVVVIVVEVVVVFVVLSLLFLLVLFLSKLFYCCLSKQNVTRNTLKEVRVVLHQATFISLCNLYKVLN